MLTESEENARDDMLATIERLEAIKRRALDMEDAVKDLIFTAGELPSKDTLAHNEFRKAYGKAADFFRDDWLKKRSAHRG